MIRPQLTPDTCPISGPSAWRAISFRTSSEPKVSTQVLNRLSTRTGRTCGYVSGDGLTLLTTDLPGVTAAFAAAAVSPVDLSYVCMLVSMAYG